ncbi:MAG TPA: GNAT family N-acetyltransferase [candidate division Zixibacteria bacterium]|nr:GNAT family N-acetyltransferase [candidate division Zixibacteria bacterium]
MKKILETERLILREFEYRDTDFLHELFGDPEFFAFLAGKVKKTRDETEAMITRMREGMYAAHGCGLWLIQLKETGEPVGYCGYLIQEIGGEKLHEIAYGLHKDYRGQGYCVEAARGCKEWGVETLGLTRIVSIVHVDNHPSARVAERNEMTPGPERELWGLPVRIFEWTADS